ncbi:MAG: carboxypeptidase regulatory-like domain-containing protein [Gemmatimonadales bacterium]
MSRSAAVVLVALWLGLILPNESSAQSVVRGTVRHAQTADALPAAIVSFEGAVALSTRTDDQGGFSLSGLPGGRYDLRVELAGFEAVRAVVALTGSDTLDLDVELSPTAQRIAELSVTAPKPRRREGLITFAEIDEVVGASRDAFELIRHLRPRYLVGRGASTLGDPTRPAAKLNGDTTGGGPAVEVERAKRTAAARGGAPHLPRVSVDDGPLQEIDVLHRIPAERVREIRLMSSLDAATRFGTGVEGGVIQVFTKD